MKFTSSAAFIVLVAETFYSGTCGEKKELKGKKPFTVEVLVTFSSFCFTKSTLAFICILSCFN